MLVPFYRTCNFIVINFSITFILVTPTFLAWHPCHYLKSHSPADPPHYSGYPSQIGDFAATLYSDLEGLLIATVGFQS